MSSLIFEDIRLSDLIKPTPKQRACIDATDKYRFVLYGGGGSGGGKYGDKIQAEHSGEVSVKRVISKPLSPGEEAFALHCRAERLTPVRELVFAPPRKWRFDFAFPEKMVAVEIEGGLFSAGRHVRGAAVEKDFEKYNAAAKLGWRVLRFSTEMVKRGLAIEDVLEVLR